MDPKPIFLAFLMLLEVPKKISERRLVEKKVYANLKVNNNPNSFPPKGLPLRSKWQIDELFFAFEEFVICFRFSTLSQVK